MKKLVLVFLAAIAVLIIVLVISSLIISLAIVKPTTDQISQQLFRQFARVVYIPKGLPPQTLNFYEIIYFWEMETPQGEIVGVRFRHTTGFDKDAQNIEAVLEVPENGDVSIFIKALPAMVADSQSLASALDIKKANFSANEQAGYSKLALSIKPETEQTNRITWTFEKEQLVRDLEGDYRKLYKFPKPLLEFLYVVQKLTLNILGQ